MLEVDPDRGAVVCLWYIYDYQQYTCSLFGSSLKQYVHDTPRAGSADGRPASDTQSINAQAALSATTAKMKSLPSLQANQDPFGPLIAYNMFWWMWFKYVQVSVCDHYLFNNKDCFLHSLMVLERKCQKWMRNRTEPSTIMIMICVILSDFPRTIFWNPVCYLSRSDWMASPTWNVLGSVYGCNAWNWNTLCTCDIMWHISTSQPKNDKDGYGIERQEWRTWSALQKADDSPKVILRCWCPKQALTLAGNIIIHCKI